MAKSAILAEERQRVEELLGHCFSDKGRLERALTHSSARASKGGNYERLEFLGDRVLGLCVAELLFGIFREATEGELSVRLNQLVSAETCAAIADEMQLHRYIRTGSDVKKLTGKAMLNVRADVIESVIAAIYLDAGMEAARSFVLRHWSARATSTGAGRRDAKTELQEWTHAHFAVTPSYVIEERSGPDHDPRFTVRVEIPGLEPAKGVDRSKRAAEQAAAQAILKREGVWTSEPTGQETSDDR